MGENHGPKVDINFCRAQIPLSLKQPFINDTQEDSEISCHRLRERKPNYKIEQKARTDTSWKKMFWGPVNT